MADGFRVDEAVLDGIASRLRNASSDLENVASPPPAPEAGACTGAVATVLALHIDSVAGAVEGVGATGDAVDESRGVYAEVDRTEADAFGGGHMQTD